MLAMPLNELDGQQSQVLLLFPTEDSFEYRIIMPRVSTNPNPVSRRIEDDELVRGFTTMFGVRDTDEPFVHNSWQIGFNSTPIKSFDKNTSRFPAVVIQMIGPDKEQLLAQAEQAARNLKLSKEKALKTFLERTGLGEPGQQ